jgi:hypothetical protein
VVYSGRRIDATGEEERVINLEEEFERHRDEYLKFNRIEKPRHPCPDVCAFVLLNEIAPRGAGRDVIVWAGHDEIALDIDCEALAEKASTDDIRDLVRCGVRYSSGDDCLKMFV